jgi:hypothetical protein
VPITCSGRSAGGHNDGVRLVERLGRLDNRVLGSRPSLGAYPQALPHGQVPQTVRRGVKFLSWAIAVSLLPIALDIGRALLASLWILAAVILIAAWATLTTRDGIRIGPLFALIGAAACGLFALWLVGVVHLASYQYAPTLALAACGGRMSWIVYRATQPGA